MNLTINAGALSKILKLVGLTNDKEGLVVLDTNSGTAKAIGVELGIAVRSPHLLVDSPNKSGQVVVGIRQLSAVVSGLLGDIKLIRSENELTVKGGRSKFEIALPLKDQTDRTLAAVAALETNGPAFPIPLTKLKAALDFASHVSDKSSLFDYYGALEISGNTVVAGTDGARLALAEFLGTQEITPTIIVPSRAARAIQELAGDDVFVSETENAVFFAAGEITLRAAKQVEKFADWRKFIPTEFETEVKFRAQDMREALKRVAPMALETVTVDVDGEQLRLFAQSPEGRAEDFVDIDVVFPDPLFEEAAHIKVTLDIRFLTDYFARAQGTVRLMLNGPQKPVYFEAGNSFKLLVAPRV